VQQLFLVTDDPVLVDSSIRDFIRCNIEKLRLSKEGNITDEGKRPRKPSVPRMNLVMK
jgi:hypothetical protein